MSDMQAQARICPTCFDDHSEPYWLAAHDREVRATADGVIRAVLDALGVGYDHDPVLAARDAASVRDRFGGWLAAHDAEVAAKAWDEGHEACALRIPEGVWHDFAAPHPGNPYRIEKGGDRG